MNISLTLVSMSEASILHSIQREAFLPLLKKYEDFDTNPANEPIEKIVERLQDDRTDYYFIRWNEEIVGAIRIIKMKKTTGRISPVFVRPSYQGNGIAQSVIREIEKNMITLLVGCYIPFYKKKEIVIYMKS